MTTMKAVRFHETGGLEVLRLEDVPRPVPGPGQALVKIEAIGVNFIDIYQRSGQYKLSLPVTLGAEAAGVVEELGPPPPRLACHYPQKRSRSARASRARVTRRLRAICADPGGAARRRPRCHRRRTAAAVILQGMTAHYLSRQHLPARPRAVLPDPCRVRWGRPLAGADRQALRCPCHRHRWQRGESGAGAPGRRGPCDSVHAPEFRQGSGYLHARHPLLGRLRLRRQRYLRRQPRLPRTARVLVLYGQSSGAVPPFDPQVLNAKGSLWLTRPTLAHYIADRPALEWRARDLFEWIAAGELHVRIDQTFPLDQAGAAHQYLSDRKSKGKVLLLPPA